MPLLPETLKLKMKRIPGLLRVVRWMRLPGQKCYCPVCGEYAESFRPLGKPSDEFLTGDEKKIGWPYPPDTWETLNYAQYGCRHCEASDRYRLYALYLNQRLPAELAAGSRELLEFGPQPAMSRFLRKFSGLRYRTADLFMEGADDRVDIMNMSLYQGGQFDIFICSHVLEHVQDDRKALAELYRILKPGGWGILMVPIKLTAKEIDEDPYVTDEGDRWRRFGQGDHVRCYSKAGFIERVRQAGFVVHQYGVDFFGAKTFQRCGITAQSMLYIVEKNQ